MAPYGCWTSMSAAMNFRTLCTALALDAIARSFPYPAWLYCSPVSKPQCARRPAASRQRSRQRVLQALYDVETIEIGLCLPPSKNQETIRHAARLDSIGGSE